MIRPLAAWVVWLLVSLAPMAAWGRGGGGCLAEGTPVLTPSGLVPVERLRVGDTVWGTWGGGLDEARVRAAHRVYPHALLHIGVGETVLRVTPEHPVMVGPGVFREARTLAAGDTVYGVQGEKPGPMTVGWVRREAAYGAAFDLLVFPRGTFVSSGLVVHNKGCFLPESPILKADGREMAISAVRKGDELLAFTPDGRPVRTRVRDVIRAHAEQYVVLRTDRATLRVTEEHPFYVGQGTYRTVEGLAPGDTLFSWDGRSFSEHRVLSLERVRERVAVFNLRTQAPHTFFAAGLAVHNKGGGGGSSRSSSGRSSSGRSGGSSGDDAGGLAAFFVFMAVFAILLVVAVRANKRSKRENLDFRYSAGQIAQKAEKTEKLLAFLARQDPAVKPQDLRRLADSTFRKLQACWQDRGYDPMRPLMTPALFSQHMAQLQGMVRNHEINRLEGLRVERIDLVNVRYTERPHQREFTALISASVRDYYVDDRSGAFLRGDSTPAKFQEFWTFQLAEDGWRLREIEQSGESDVLQDENFVEMLTDDTLKGIYGEAAAREGSAGPWLARGEGKKAARTERLLNFLARTDKLWNRTQMLERARQVFMNVYLARETADPARVPAGDLFPEVARSLKEQIRQWQKDGVRVEYRNLCVRKAELILVRNFAEKDRDEFTVRIDAHAQKIVRKGDKTLSGQQYVTPFEEYWTLGRLDDQWKLKEVLPPARGKTMVKEENVDEDSTAGQLDWYYRQSRTT